MTEVLSGNLMCVPFSYFSRGFLGMGPKVKHGVHHKAKNLGVRDRGDLLAQDLEGQLFVEFIGPRCKNGAG